MALQSSGQISLGDIAAEYGGSAPHSLSEYYGDGNAPSSGEIQLAADFYGTSSFTSLSASGGSVSTSGIYKYHTFTSSGTFTVSATGTSNTLEYVVVAGGGGGGKRHAAGGGAGGYRTGSTTTGTGSYGISIGGGGAGGTSWPGSAPNGGNQTVLQAAQSAAVLTVVVAVAEHQDRVIQVVVQLQVVQAAAVAVVMHQAATLAVLVAQAAQAQHGLMALHTQAAVAAHQVAQAEQAVAHLTTQQLPQIAVAVVVVATVIIQVVLADQALLSSDINT